MYTEQLKALAAMSNKYGSNPAYVLAGGGNTSFKSDKNLWVKGSGTSLATIKPEDFVVLERAKLDEMWSANYPEEEKAREAAVLADMMAARVEGESRRPSVETLLHNLVPQKYILHVHPAIVNGITCSVEGKAAMERLFPGAVWVDACKPGYILALECKTMMDAYKAEHGKDVDLLFLQNHGIFFAAETAEEAGQLAQKVMQTLTESVKREPDLSEAPVDADKVSAIAKELADLYGEGAHCVFTSNKEVLAYDPATKSLSPDHIVYAKAKQLAVCTKCDLKKAVADFEAENGYKAKIVFVKDMGMFSLGMNENEAKTAGIVMLDAIKVVAYTESFGGVQPMPEFLIDFIVNWEVESYRSKVSLSK